MITLGAMVTCGFMAVWQWQRAGSAMGSTLNVGYGLQWPVFAVFFAYMWWRMLRMEAATLAAEPDVSPEEAEPEPVPAAGPVQESRSPFGPRPASVTVSSVTDDEDPELAEYNRMLAALAVRDNT